MGLNTAQEKRKRRYGSTVNGDYRARAKNRARSGPPKIWTEPNYCRPKAIVPGERQAGGIPEKSSTSTHRLMQEKSCTKSMGYLQAFPWHDSSG